MLRLLRLGLNRRTEQRSKRNGEGETRRLEREKARLGMKPSCECAEHGAVECLEADFTLRVYRRKRFFSVSLGPLELGAGKSHDSRSAEALA